MDAEKTRPGRLRSPPVLFYAVMLAVFLVDFFSKQLIWHWRPDLDGATILGIAEFEFYRNHGMMLGLGASLDPSIRVYLLAAVSGLVLAGLTLYLIHRGFSNAFRAGVWGLVVGSGLANLYERVFTGAVTDFLRLDAGSLQTGIFNLADLFNLVGLLILAAIVLRTGQWR